MNQLMYSYRLANFNKVINALITINLYLVYINSVIICFSRFCFSFNVTYYINCLLYFL